MIYILPLIMGIGTITGVVIDEKRKQLKRQLRLKHYVNERYSNK